METTTITRTVSLGCPQAISIELRYVLPADWTLEQKADTFIVRGPMKEGWQSEIWRVTRFVAYSPFVSLEQVEWSSRHVEQVVVSIDSRGGGYRIRFLLGDP